jgi:hypothetical protein
VKPPIYGYLRATDDLHDDEIRQRELGLAKLAVAEIVTGLFEDSLSRDEQITFGHQLQDLAKGFRQRR